MWLYLEEDSVAEEGLGCSSVDSLSFPSARIIVVHHVYLISLVTTLQWGAINFKQLIIP